MLLVLKLLADVTARIKILAKTRQNASPASDLHHSRQAGNALDYPAVDDVADARLLAHLVARCIIVSVGFAEIYALFIRTIIVV